MDVVIDAMNVLGSRPDGWWRDRDGALRRLAAEVDAWAATTDVTVWLIADGRPVEGLEAGPRGALEVRYARRGGRDAADDRIVEVVATLEEASRAAPSTGTTQNGSPTPSGGSEPQLEDESCAVEGATSAGLPQVEVVTADRDLAARVRALGATVTGPRAFLARVAETAGDP